MKKKTGKKDIPLDVEISDRDVYDAMKDMDGYIDITPGDFQEIYRIAYRHAFQRIAGTVLAKDIMTREVLTVAIDTSLKDIADLMAREGISGVPVVDNDGKVVGVVSEKDFISRMGGGDSWSFMGVVAECLGGKGCVALPIRAQKAGDIMSKPAITIDELTTVKEIADTFTDKNINRVPVVDAASRLTGIVSRADIVRASSTQDRT